MKYYKQFTFMKIDLNVQFNIKTNNEYFSGNNVTQLVEIFNNTDIYNEVNNMTDDRYYKVFCYNLSFLKHILPVQEISVISQDYLTEEIKVISYKNKYIFVDFQLFAGFNIKNIDKFISDSDPHIIDMSLVDKMEYIFNSRSTYYKSPLFMPGTFSGFVQTELNRLKVSGLFHNRLPKCSEDIQDIFLKLPRAGCYGYNPQKLDTFIDNVYNYDINTAHIYQMCNMDYPIGRAHKVKKRDNLSINVINDLLYNRQWLFVATIKIKIIDKINGYDHLGIVGEVQELTYTSNIWNYIFNNYNYEVLKVIDIVYYMGKSKLPKTLVDYLKHGYSIKKNSSGAEREYAKLKLNIVFGLFFRKGQYYQDKFPMIVGAFTLAYTTEQLLNVMNNPKADVVYWDTDGFYSTTPIESITLGEDMGEFKLEEGPLKYFGLKQYWFNGEFKMSGLNKELAQKYYQGNIPCAGDVIPPEYTGNWTYNHNSNKFELKRFTIGNKIIIKNIIHN